jgi:predicted thioesterase
MDIKLEAGITNSLSQEVKAEHTAASFGSGLVEVFATPAMIALMENTAMQLVLPFLPEGFGTVGTMVNIKHLKATPIGQTVTCEAKLISAEGKKLFFEVKARDEQGEIGSGTHNRYIINTSEFMEKVNSQAGKS